MSFKNDAHKALVYVENRLWEISTLLGLPSSETDGRLDIPGDEISRTLARELVAAMASYMSCVEEEQRWSSETFSGLACNIERVLREHGLKPPLPEDEEDPALNEPAAAPAEFKPPASISEPKLLGGIGGAARRLRFRQVAWFANKDCPFCLGGGLRLSSDGKTILYPNELYGGGRAYHRKVCECVESEDE
jgi:hypothetical protein